MEPRDPRCWYCDDRGCSECDREIAARSAKIWQALEDRERPMDSWQERALRAEAKVMRLEDELESAWKQLLPRAAAAAPKPLWWPARVLRNVLGVVFPPPPDPMDAFRSASQVVVGREEYNWLRDQSTQVSLMIRGLGAVAMYATGHFVQGGAVQGVYCYLCKARGADTLAGLPHTDDCPIPMVMASLSVETPPPGGQTLACGCELRMLRCDLHVNSPARWVEFEK